MIRAKTKRISGERAVLAQYNKQIENIVAIGGQWVMNEAKSSIQEHRSFGRQYGKHTASMAGNPPNSDTGYLANNIYLEIDDDKLGCSVESRAAYSEALEFGTSKMAARPFLQPALESQRGKIRTLFARMKARGK